VPVVRRFRIDATGSMGLWMLASQRALVVDDDTSMCKAMQRMLRHIGFEATVAHTATAAMAAFDGARTYDVVLLDIDLPDLTGHALLRRLRAIGVDVPIIMITGSADMDDAILALRNGAIDLLRKPFGAPALDLALARSLGRRADAAAADGATTRGASTAVAAPPATSEGTPAAGAAAVAGSGSTVKVVHPGAQIQRIRSQLERGELQLPVIDPRLASLQTFLAGGEYTMDDVAGVVCGDPALTAGVLRLANSAYFSRGEIGSVAIACQRLGTSRVVGIALEIAVQGQFQYSSEPFRTLLHNQWRNAVVTGMVAREIGPLCKIRDRDRLHVAGLLHNIGELATIRMYADAAPETPVEQLAAEAAALHEDIGRAIGKAWSLPNYVVGLAGHHHRPPRHENEPRRILRLIVLTAWNLALKAGYTYLPGQDTCELAPLLAMLGLRENSVAPILDLIPTWEI
jgi:HD-like signal output (HDOD) protein/FixJ family two-component response regulator